MRFFCGFFFGKAPRTIMLLASHDQQAEAACSRGVQRRTGRRKNSKMQENNRYSKVTSGDPTPVNFKTSPSGYKRHTTTPMPWFMAYPWLTAAPRVSTSIGSFTRPPQAFQVFFIFRDLFSLRTMLELPVHKAQWQPPHTWGRGLRQARWSKTWLK